MEEILKIRSPFTFKRPVLAFGADLKASFSIGLKETISVHRIEGDLKSLKTYDLYVSSLKKALRRLAARPAVIGCDMHPGYISARIAARTAAGDIPLEYVQHHHAHMACCIADNKRPPKKSIGVIFDGTGYGLDSKMWGSEFLVGGLRGYKRAAHLEYFPAPGADASVKEPWRLALSLLYMTYGARCRDLDIPFIRSMNAQRRDTILEMIEADINSPKVCGIGRLFDAVSSLLGLGSVALREAALAIKLEELSDKDFTGAYRIDIVKDREACLIVKAGPFIRQIVLDMTKGVPKGRIARKFHNTITRMTEVLCKRIRDEYGAKDVFLSGGAFNNKILSGSIRAALEGADFNVHSHNKTSTTDIDISLGQALVAGARRGICV